MNKNPILLPCILIVVGLILILGSRPDVDDKLISLSVTSYRLGYKQAIIDVNERNPLDVEVGVRELRERMEATLND